MHSAHSSQFVAMLDLTLPERMERGPASALVLPTNSSAITAKWLDNLRQSIRVCLPWCDATAEPKKTSLLPHTVVVIVSGLVLAICLKLGASLAILCWWGAATLAMLWALAKDGAERVVIENKESAQETATVAIVMAQFVSMAVLWTTFYMVRLR
jgi:hypothetical protein